MKYQIKKLPKSEIEIEIELPQEEFKNFIDEAILELGKDLEVEGFRKGKIPREIIEREIGQERALKAAIERAIKNNYLKVVLDNKIEAIGQPEVEILKMPGLTKVDSGIGVPVSPLSFRTKIVVLPPITLPDYRKIAPQIKKGEIFVEEKEIENTLKWMQKSRAKLSQVERAAQKEDFVEIEYRCPQIENNKSQKDGFILGQGHLIEGFEEKLEGIEANEEKTFSLKFPENHFQKDLAGKELNFGVKMLSVQKMELPKIDDQFAKSLGSFPDLGSLRGNIKEGIRMEKEILEKQKAQQEILNRIIKEISWELPEILIEREKNHMVENLKILVKEKFKITFGDYLVKINKSEKDLRDSFQSEAETKIKSSLVLREIAKVENITIDEGEAQERLNQALDDHPDIKTAEKKVDLGKLKDYYKEVIRNEKTLQLLEGFIK